MNHALNPGAKLGSYEVLGALGAGGVYLHISKFEIRNSNLEMR